MSNETETCALEALGNDRLQLEGNAQLRLIPVIKGQKGTAYGGTGARTRNWLWSELLKRAA